jgi:hypothetical protein
MGVKRTTRGFRSTLERRVVVPLFERVQAEYPPDRSLPEVVVTNRRRRAQERLVEALVSRGTAKIPAELERRVESLVRDWAVRSFDDGFASLQEFEIQCAREHDLVVALESGDSERVLSVLEQEYRQRIVEQFGSVELRGIQISHRVPLDLDKVYVPLHLESSIQDTQADPVRQVRLFEERMPVADVLREHRRVLIVGSPGSGKTTLVAFLATGLADGRLAGELGWKERPLPLVLMVRTLKQVSLTPRWLARQLDMDERLAARVLEEGRAILFVDGLDEASEDLRKKLLASLNRFVDEYPGARVIVTSRPAGTPGEIEKRLANFRPFRLADLTPEEVDAFIDKWCLAAESSVRKDASEAEREARVAADDLKSRISRSRPVQRIAVNPLLTTILCVVHRFLGRSIPEHRVTLYEKCTDALLYEWDRAKFSEGAAVGGLDAPQKRMLLRGVARSLHDRHEAEIPEAEVVRHFAKVLPELGKPESDARRIVHEIRDRSGLLVERRPGYFGFSHLTFQEYLTALDYVYSKQCQHLIDRWEDPWWHEVIPLAAGVQGSDPRRIARGLLAKKSDVATILAAECLETAIDMPLSVRQQIEKALGKLVPPRDYGDLTRLRGLGVIVAPLLLKVLPKADTHGRTLTLMTLEQIEYDPAIPVIARCVSDSSPSYYTIVLAPGIEHQHTVSELATFVLLQKAHHSEAGRRAFAAALQQPQDHVFLEFLREGLGSWRWTPGKDRVRELLGMIDAALEATLQEKPIPTPAGSTA